MTREQYRATLNNFPTFDQVAATWNAREKPKKPITAKYAAMIASMAMRKLRHQLRNDRELANYFMETWQ